MKKYIFPIYIFVMSLLVISCDSDTESITNPGTFSLPDEIRIDFIDSNSNASFDEGETITFSLRMAGAVGGSADVAISVTSSDGTVEANYPSTVTIDSGQLDATFDITFEDDGVLEPPFEEYTIAISSVDIQLDNGSYSHYLFSGDSSRKVTVKDILPPIVTIVGDLDINFNWDDASDQDIRIRDYPPTMDIDTGYSTSPGENVTLPSSVPDGDYLVSIRPWTVIETTLGYNLELVSPTVTQTYFGTLTGLDPGGGWSQEINVMMINKSSSGPVITYTITQL